jgi:integrase
MANTVKAYLREANGNYHVRLFWYQGGKRKEKSIGTGIPVKGNNKRRAEAEMKRILTEWDAKVTDNFTDILFSDYLKQWLDTTRHTIKDTTYHSYKLTIVRKIVPYFEEKRIKLHEIKAYHIDAFYTWMLSQGVSGNTVLHYHANIHKALRHAYQTDRIHENPASKVTTLPKKEKFRGTYYTSDELKLLLDAARGTRLEVPIMLASWFGLRRGEAVGLQWQDICFSTMTLLVRGVVVDKGLGSRAENLRYREGAKTEASIRTFPLPPEVADYLQELKARQEDNRWLAGSSYSTSWDGFVCVDVLGNLILPDYLSRAFPNFLDKHGLRQICFHELRDSNASLLVDKGVDIRRIQGWLGHANYRMTEKYAHLRADAKRSLGAVLSADLVPV